MESERTVCMAQPHASGGGFWCWEAGRGRGGVHCRCTAGALPAPPLPPPRARSSDVGLDGARVAVVSPCACDWMRHTARCDLPSASVACTPCVRHRAYGTVMALRTHYGQAASLFHSCSAQLPVQPHTLGYSRGLHRSEASDLTLRRLTSETHTACTPASAPVSSNHSALQCSTRHSPRRQEARGTAHSRVLPCTSAMIINTVPNRTQSVKLVSCTTCCLRSA